MPKIFCLKFLKNEPDKKFFSLFFVFSIFTEKIEKKVNKDIFEEIINNKTVPDILLKDLSPLKLTARSYNALWKYEFIGDIVCNPNLGENFSRLLSRHNFGKKSYRELIESLTAIGYPKYFECLDYWKLRPLYAKSDPQWSED